MRITVVGSGYVGLSNAVLLSQHNDVIVNRPGFELTPKSWTVKF